MTVMALAGAAAAGQMAARQKNRKRESFMRFHMANRSDHLHQFNFRHMKTIVIKTFNDYEV